MTTPEHSFSCQMVIDKQHPSLAGHFPGNPIVPGVVILDQVLHNWQQRRHKTVREISHTKFVHVLKADCRCTIRFREKNDCQVDFFIADGEQLLIAKGMFSYDE